MVVHVCMQKFVYMYVFKYVYECVCRCMDVEMSDCLIDHMYMCTQPNSCIYFRVSISICICTSHVYDRCVRGVQVVG